MQLTEFDDKGQGFRIIMNIINGIYLFVSHSEIFYKNLLKTSRKYSEKYIC